MPRKKSKSKAKVVSAAPEPPAFVRPEQRSAAGITPPDVFVAIIAGALQGVAPADYSKRKRELKLVAWRWRDTVALLSMETAVVSGIRSMQGLLAACRRKPDRAKRLRSLTISILKPKYLRPDWSISVSNLIEICAVDLHRFELELSPTQGLWGLDRAFDKLKDLRSFIVHHDVTPGRIEEMTRQSPHLTFFETPVYSHCLELNHSRLNVSFLNRSVWSQNDALLKIWSRFNDLARIDIGLVTLGRTVRDDARPYVIELDMLRLILKPVMQTLRFYAGDAERSTIDSPMATGLVRRVHARTRASDFTALSLSGPNSTSNRRELVFDHVDLCRGQPFGFQRWSGDDWAGAGQLLSRFGIDLKHC